jgi:hypothetical protein
MPHRRSLTRYRPLAIVALVALTAWLLAAPAALAEDPPLSLDTIAEMRANRTTPLVILRELRARGRAFDLDESAREQLGELGFSRRQLAVIDKVERVESTEDEGSDGAAEAGPAAASIELSPEDTARLERIDRIVTQAVKAAGGITVVETARARLLLGPGVPPALADDARKLEQLLAKTFPGPLATGIDKRGVNIAVFLGQSEYTDWIKALEKAFTDNGVGFNNDGMSFEQRALSAPAVYLDGITTMRVTGQPEDARRTVVHAAAFHGLGQLTRRHCGDALQSGFANVAETMVFGGPSITVAGGYAGREIGAANASWAQMVKQRFADGTADTVGQVLGCTFDVMEVPQYAECWSLATVLCMKPEQFSQLVLDLRGGGQPLAAIETIYESTEAALTEGWKALALQAR